MKGPTNAQALIGNGTLKIQGNGSDASTFTANSTSDVTLNIKGSGATTVSKSAANEITVSSTDQSVSSVSNHYSPTGTTSKDASGGTLTDITNSSSGTQVVTGVNIDAAGHVTGVKSVALKSTDTNTWPSKVSQLTNDSGYITSSGSCNYASSAGSAGSASSSTLAEYSKYWLMMTGDDYATKRRARFLCGRQSKSNDYNASVSFSPNFPGTPDVILVTPYSNDNGSAPSSGWQIKSKSASGFNIVLDAGSTIAGFEWMAIYWI